MRFKDFERHARSVFEDIPDAYRSGVDGLVVSRDAPRHPDLPGVYTLGECRTEDHPSDYGSSDTTRSVIVLYWGSFESLAGENPAFDWEEEIWETLTHELRHHLESLAGDDALEDVDYAADETHKRLEGRDFDPWYYQYGEPEDDGVYRVEKARYVEIVWSHKEFERADALPLRWAGRDYRIAKPEELGDVHYVLVNGIEMGDEILELVLVRKRRWWDEIKRLVGAPRATVLESEGEAEPVE